MYTAKTQTGEVGCTRRHAALETASLKNLLDTAYSAVVGEPQMVGGESAQMSLPVASDAHKPSLVTVREESEGYDRGVEGVSSTLAGRHDIRTEQRRISLPTRLSRYNLVFNAILTCVISSMFLCG